MFLGLSSTSLDSPTFDLTILRGGEKLEVVKLAGCCIFSGLLVGFCIFELGHASWSFSRTWCGVITFCNLVAIIT